MLQVVLMQKFYNVFNETVSYNNEQFIKLYKQKFVKRKLAYKKLYCIC